VTVAERKNLGDKPFDIHYSFEDAERAAD